MTLIVSLSLSACSINYPDDIQRALDNIDTPISQQYDIDNIDDVMLGMQVIYGGYNNDEVIYIIADELRDDGADVGFSTGDNLIVLFLADDCTKSDAVAASTSIDLVASMLGNETLNIVIICDEYNGYYYNNEWIDF